MSQGETDTLEVGAKVQMNTDTGSYGEVRSARSDGSGYFITFHYGKDRQGNPVTAQSGLIPRKNLRRVSEEVFQAKRNSNFWDKVA